MVLKQTVDPVLERLITAWLDAEAIRDMPELFTEDKLAQIASAAMAAIEDAWVPLGPRTRDLAVAPHRWLRTGELENWAGKKHVRLD